MPRKRPPVRPCQICMRIRMFVAVAALMIIGLPLMGGQLPMAEVLTPWHFAAAVCAMGGVIVALKVIEYRRDRQADDRDPHDPTPGA